MYLDHLLVHPIQLPVGFIDRCLVERRRHGSKVSSAPNHHRHHLHAQHAQSFFENCARHDKRLQKHPQTTQRLTEQALPSSQQLLTHKRLQMPSKRTLQEATARRVATHEPHVQAKEDFDTTGQDFRWPDSASSQNSDLPLTMASLLLRLGMATVLCVAGVSSLDNGVAVRCLHFASSSCHPPSCVNLVPLT